MVESVPVSIEDGIASLILNRSDRLNAWPLVISARRKQKTFGIE